MLKKRALKKILITTLAFILVNIIYFFPNNKIKTEVKYQNVDKMTLYIPNNNQYVSRIKVIKGKDDNTINIIKEIINYLTIDSNNKDYLPNNFIPIIPKNTKLLSVDLNDGLLKINFSKEFLNISINKEKQLLESIIYSLTELKEVDKIMIFIDGEKLNYYPNSKTKLPLTLDRSIGINTKYTLTDFKDAKTYTTYYIGKDNNIYYYIPITTVANFNDEKISVIIEELKSAPTYQTNLISFLRANVELKEYELLENKIRLSFNNLIFDDLKSKKIIEEIKYCISLSIKDTYNIDTIIFNVNNVDIEEFKI